MDDHQRTRSQRRVRQQSLFLIALSDDAATTAGTLPRQRLDVA